MSIGWFQPFFSLACIRPNVTSLSLGREFKRSKSSVTTAANDPAEHLWEYDEAGNIILETLPEGESIVRGYDAMDRPNFVLKGSDQRHMDYASRKNWGQTTIFYLPMMTACSIFNGLRRVCVNPELSNPRFCFDAKPLFSIC